MAASISPPTVRTVLEALAQHPGSTAAQLAAAAGLGRSTVSKALAQLEADQLAARQTQGSDGGRRLADRWTLLTERPASEREKQPKLGLAQPASASPRRRRRLTSWSRAQPLTISPLRTLDALARASYAGWCWPTYRTGRARSTAPLRSPRPWGGPPVQ